MEACLKAANEVYAETSAKNADFKKVLTVDEGVPERSTSGGRSPKLGYDNFMVAHAHAADRRESQPTLRKAPER